MVAPIQSSGLTTVDTLVSQLSQALGEEKAREVLEDTIVGMGLSGGALTREQALQVLGLVAETPGIVGVCARFARSRFMLSSIPQPWKPG